MATRRSDCSLRVRRQMKAPADASNGRGLLVPAIDRKLLMAGRRPANSVGGKWGGRRTRRWYIEAHKSASGVHKIFRCRLWCNNTSTASVACPFPVIYRGRAYSSRETLFDCVSRAPDRRGGHCLEVHSIREQRKRRLEGKHPLGPAAVRLLVCKLRLQAGATRSHRIVFGRVLLPLDATRTSVTSGHDPPT
jgi:hypothetical protein